MSIATNGRREFLKWSVAALGFWAVPSAFRRLLACPSRTAVDGGLVEIADDETSPPLLKLRRGFRSRSFGWTGDAMSSGSRTPGAHDGTGISADQDGVLNDLPQSRATGRALRSRCRLHPGRGDGAKQQVVLFHVRV